MAVFLQVEVVCMLSAYGVLGTVPAIFQALSFHPLQPSEVGRTTFVRRSKRPSAVSLAQADY